MTITLVPESQTVSIVLSQVQYDLLSAGVTKDQPLFEQLLMSYCQQVQRDQQDTDQNMLKDFAETATPEQRAAVLASITELQAPQALVKGQL